VEIITTDETAGVITVRDTANGSVYKLRVSELVAGPPASWAAPKPASTPAPAAEPQPVATQETVESPAPAHAPVAGQTTDVELAAAHKTQGDSLAEGPGYRISRGVEAPASAPPASLAGPGYTITREEPVAGASEPKAEAEAMAAEKRTDPIICQGDRLMRIDGETIDFTGDAVIAEKGCDLYISNARIRAGGVGIIARQARVHIVNSTIGGTRGSYEASEGAEIYVARSTFSGIGRRFDNATMNDLGGNEYLIHR
jgi:hypothetical protein